MNSVFYIIASYVINQIKLAIFNWWELRISIDASNLEIYLKLCLRIEMNQFYRVYLN